MKRFRYEYGASPLHLVAALAALAVAGVALNEVLSTTGRPGRYLLWLGGASVAHDLVLFPLYAGAGWLLARALAPGDAPSRFRIAALNHVRVPALLSGLMLLVWFPVVARRAPTTFERGTGLSADPYRDRWLLFTAVLFSASALLLAVRAPRLRRATDRHSPVTRRWP